jgi:hypothetical protein
MLNRHRIVVAVATVLIWTGISAKAFAGPFQPGDFFTFLQDDWGDGSAPADTSAPGLLDSHFTSIYGSLGYMDVGVLGSAGNYAMLFTSPSALFTYLPSSGVPAPLTATLVDPTSSASGIFGGEVVALRLNVDFSDAGYTTGALGIPFGDLVIHDYAPLPEANGGTVRQFLDQANLALGGGIPSYSYDPARVLLQELNFSFGVTVVQNPDGSVLTEQQVSQFAQDHLAVAAAAPVPEPATLSLLGIGLAALTTRRFRRNRGLPSLTQRLLAGKPCSTGPTTFE